MDSWIEEEIARELERMGIEDIESMEEEEYEDVEEVIEYNNTTETTVTGTPSNFDIHKYQRLQASCWDGLEDILVETRTILSNKEHGCQQIEDKHGVIDKTNSHDDIFVTLMTDHQQNEEEMPVMRENQVPTITVLNELKEQEQVERDQIMKQIEDKDREIQALVNERRRFIEKLEEQFQHELYLKKRSCTVIQSHWRGYRSRKLIAIMKQELKNRRNYAATLIQRNWRKCYQFRNIMASRIQQCYRHYRCRKMIQYILRAARQNAIHTSTDMVSSPIQTNKITNGISSAGSNHITDSPPTILVDSQSNHVQEYMDHTNSNQGCSTMQQQQDNSDEAITKAVSICLTPIISPTNNHNILPSPTAIDSSNSQLTLHVEEIEEKEQGDDSQPTILDASLINHNSSDDSHLSSTSDEVPMLEQQTQTAHPHNHPVLSSLSQLYSSCRPTSRPPVSSPCSVNPEVESLEEHESATTHSKDIPHKQTTTRSSTSSVWGNLKVSNKEMVQKALSGLMSESTSVTGTSSHTILIEGVASSSQPSQSVLSTNTTTIPANHQPLAVLTNGCHTSSNNQPPTALLTNTTSIPITSSSNHPVSSEQAVLYCSSNPISSPPLVPTLSNASKEATLSSPTCVSKSSPCLLSDKTPQDDKQLNGNGLDQVSSSKDVTSTELQDMIALRESRSKEECSAQSSRVRMSQMFSAEQISDMANEIRKGETYTTRLEHAASPLSTNAWAGLIHERLKLWQKSRQQMLKPSSIDSLNSHSFIRTPSTSSSCITLSNAQLLSASLPGTLINKVALVHVYRSRSPIDLTCLSQCPELRSLFLAKCQLNNFCDIGNENSSLVEVSLPCNVIDTIDLCQVPSLAFLDLSENRLASIHGLNSCSNLLELIVDENRIARIGRSLQSCKKLQKLSIDGNLIIDASGILSLHNLQHLSLGENHLPSLNSISNCTVLQVVKLHQNNLQMCPSFTNHCLLRELILSENCLSDILLLEQAWLPLLQTLDLTNNCISSVNSLVCCMKLEYLNIQQNNLYDLPSFLHCIRGCYDLKELSTVGNPIEDEPKYRRMILKAVPGLKGINGSATGIKKKSTVPQPITDNPLYKLCSRQIHEQDMMKEKHLENIRDLNTSDIKCPSVISSLLERKVNDCEEYGNLLRCHLEEQATFDGIFQMPLYERIKIKQQDAAIIIQSYWRSYRARHKYLLTLQSVIIIQRWWRQHSKRRTSSDLPRETTTDRQALAAAIVIQAHYRGYTLRKKLRRILSQIDQEQQQQEEEEELEEVEISLDESILSDDYNMKPLTPTDEDINKYLSQYKNKSQNSVSRGQVPVVPTSQSSVNYMYTIPKYTLPGAAAEEDEVVQPMVGRPSYGLRQESLMSEIQGVVPSLNQRETTRREREKHGASLPPEPVTRNVDTPPDMTAWNFTSPVTADLMKRRAQRHRRLQRAASERLRLNDPSERLAVFRKTQSHLNRSEDKPLAQSSPRRRPSEEPVTVFQWSHEKKVIHRELVPSDSKVHNKHHHHHHHHHQPVPSPAKSYDNNKQSSEQVSTVLPKLEPHVLAGYTPRLVTSTIQNELVNKQIDSKSPTKTKLHRKSLDSVQSTSHSSLTSIYQAWS